jgi:Ni/Co efflux regulator RcnB
MNKMLCLSAAAILAFATAASAQAPGDHRDDHGNGSHAAPQHAAAPQTRAVPQQHAAPTPRAVPRTVHASEDNRGANNRGEHRNNRSSLNTNASSINPTSRHGNNGATSANNHGAPNPNYIQYHRNVTASHPFHAQAYGRPSGWYSHRWTYGEFLPSLFWAQNFWLNDYNDFGLMPPPPGTVWVRDDSDALLIDRYTGEVIEVEYNVFY